MGLTVSKSAIEWPLRLAILVSLCACMDSPRNGLKLNLPGDSFKFSGQVVNASDSLKLTVKDQHDGSWDTIATATAGTTGNNDGRLTWFAFNNNNAKIPFGISASTRKYWRKASTSGTQRRIKAELVGSSAQQGDLHTFDTDADACMNQQSTGQDVINNCQSSSSPIASVLANCGKRDQVCCAAEDIEAVKRCDHGANCDTLVNTCSIGAGGLNQQCNADGTCSTNLACFNNSCVNIVENTPITTMELVIHTCNSANAQTKARKFVVVDTGTRYLLDHPGTDTGAPNSEDTWGISIPGVNRLGDLRGITLKLADQTTDGWCFDRVDLVVNGTRVFRKSFNPGVNLDSDGGDRVIEKTVARDDELRTAFAALNRDAMCALPAGITFAQIQHTVEGSMGHLFDVSQLDWVDQMSNADDFDAWWGDEGSVTVSRVNNDSADIAVRFRAREETSIFEFEGTVTAHIRLGFTCDWQVLEQTCDSGGCDLKNCSTDFHIGADLTSLSVDADSVLDGLFNGTLSALGEWALEGSLEARLRSFQGYDDYFEHAQDLVCAETLATDLVCDQGGELCGCPKSTVGTSEVTHNWANFGQSSINVAALPIPIPMCQR
jgi:hypothetical protein